MEFLETIFAYIGLLGVLAVIGAPLIIFSATPHMPFWYKSGRIIFLWVCATAWIGFVLYETLSNPEEIEHFGGGWKYAYQHHILVDLWFIFLINVYIGWFEFLWRCVYRQWAWPPLKNIQYGLVSNLCILGSAAFTIPLVLLLTVVGIVKTVY